MNHLFTESDFLTLIPSAVLIGLSLGAITFEVSIYTSSLNLSSALKAIKTFLF